MPSRKRVTISDTTIAEIESTSVPGITAVIIVITLHPIAMAVIVNRGPNLSPKMPPGN